MPVAFELLADVGGQPPATTHRKLPAPPGVHPSVTKARVLIALACAMTLAVLCVGGLLVEGVRHSVVVCEESLPAVPAPAGWQVVAVEPELGGFGLSYWMSMPKYGLGYGDVSLVELGVCPGEGASVEPWFAATGPGDASYLRHPGELRVRHSPDGAVHVVTGRVDGAGPERFVTAFRRQHQHRVALLSRRAAACLGMDVLALVVLGAGIARARAQAAPRGPHPRSRPCSSPRHAMRAATSAWARPP